MRLCKALSHERLIEAAKKEFLEKGYMKASMREIGSLAGMSQAAIYRHYLNKEDMFSSLVEPGIEALRRLASEHERSAYSSFDDKNKLGDLFGNNNTKLIKELILNYRDEFKLILTKSKGTKYEGFIHSIVEEEVKGTRKALDYIKASGLKIRDVSDQELHMLISAYITACFEPIVHDWPLDEALRALDTIEEFFIPGWSRIFGL